MMILI